MRNTIIIGCLALFLLSYTPIVQGNADYLCVKRSPSCGGCTINSWGNWESNGVRTGYGTRSCSQMQFRSYRFTCSQAYYTAGSWSGTCTDWTSGSWRTIIQTGGSAQSLMNIISEGSTYDGALSWANGCAGGEGNEWDSKVYNTVASLSQNCEIAQSDPTPPTCTTNISPNGWTSGNVTVSATCSDSQSGCTGNPSNQTITNHGQKANFTVKDNAGNIGRCVSAPANIDRVPPTCTTSISPKGWTSGDVTASATCFDAQSGCTGNPANQTITKNGKTVTFTVTDNAGKTGTCTSAPAKIDRVAPTCSSTLDTMEWSRFPVMSSVVCSDTGGSGCRADSYVKTIKIDKHQGKGKFTVKDNAGNTGVCESPPAKIDTTPPGGEASIQ